MMKVELITLAVILSCLSGVVWGTVSAQFLDMVSLRCLDKILEKKTMKESELKATATAVAEEILQTLEFLESEYLYQVAVVLGGQGTDGYDQLERNHTGQKPPAKDVVHHRYYPMGFFSAYTFIYAAFKK